MTLTVIALYILFLIICRPQNGEGLDMDFYIEVDPPPGW